MAKRQAATKPAARPRSTRQPDGVTETIAVYVGRTLGELLNRKDELQKQLAHVEEQIGDVRNDIGARVAKYLPKGLLRRKAPRKPVRKAAKRTSRPRHVHGDDRETAKARMVERTAASTDRTRISAHPRSAPRATRRG